ncbi:MAG: SGNH/GDSL hydrolase family protein [Deltaproteobacteria bacterium]|nr:SGNH/GDSL hydrolase family protein [Deltaproteobacteria bacterium]
MKKILFKILLIMVLLTMIFILPLFYPSGIAIYFRLFLLFLIIVESFKLFKIIFIDIKIIHGDEPQSKLWVSYPPLRGIVQLTHSATLRFRNWSFTNKIISNLGTVLFSIFATFILLEAIFMFIPRSHSVDYTLASKLWYAKYWKPINSLGFRDEEPRNNNPVILFVGDSFTTGHGLKSVDDRFSNIVGNELNKKERKYTVINIGKNNLDSKGEYDSMKNFLYLTRIKPEKIILQYFGNDIENVAMNNGIIFDGFRPPPDMNRFLILVGSGSYFLNYVYWLFPREYLSVPYITFLTQAYKNDSVLSRHKNDLRLFVDYAKENSIQLIVVVFPLLNDVEMSDSLYGNNIVSFFENNNITTINVSSLVNDLAVSERIININDGHASPKVNKIVAEEILRKLEQ